MYKNYNINQLVLPLNLEIKIQEAHCIMKLHT